MKYRDRNGIEQNDTTSQDNFLEKLYGSSLGRALLQLITRPIVSKAIGLFMDSRASSFIIKPFIIKNNIDKNDYVNTEYHSYNEFFTRRIKHIKRPIDLNLNHVISPSDGKISAYPIDSNSIFSIKDSKYSISSLLKSKRLARYYMGGYCVIIRLTVDNYHRYCYIDNGKKSDNYFIPGVLHTVNPIVLDHINIYKENSREYTLLKTDHFGTVAQIEVGALMVGRINNHMGAGYMHKGFEKGMFEFGGSTIVLLFQPNKVVLDQDLFDNTKDGYETIIKMGEKIGKKL